MQRLIYFLSDGTTVDTYSKAIDSGLKFKAELVPIEEKAPRAVSKNRLFKDRMRAPIAK